MLPFVPFFRNPHLLTIAGNFWRRPTHGIDFPVTPHVYDTEPGVKILVHSQRPLGKTFGELILVHGLEGSSEAGYARSMAVAALQLGYAVHRFNMRSCGGTESLAATNYHAGQTSDLLSVIKQISKEYGNPIFLGGFSLGGNVVLKLAGELGDSAAQWIHGVCAVSTPIDLAACVKYIERPANFIYEWRFLSRLKQRIRVRHLEAPEIYPVEGLDKISTIYDFDDQYTGRFFGFGGAEKYYGTQSSMLFLDRIRVPTLVIQAKDDPLIPFRVYDRPEFRTNPHLQLLAVEHGGHLGFIAAKQPRFWLDSVVLTWIQQITAAWRAESSAKREQVGDQTRR